MLQVKNSSQKLADVQHCSRVMLGICFTKPLVGAALEGAGPGLPSSALPPALCDGRFGLSAFLTCGSSSVPLFVLEVCSTCIVVAFSACAYMHHAQCIFTQQFWAFAESALLWVHMCSMHVHMCSLIMV